jgi:hypothetical protein
MYAPAPHDEITSLVNYVDQQLAAIRASAYGLTEAQARERPCRSALSIGGILKHTAYGMRGASATITEGPESAGPDETGFANYFDSFALGENETTVGVLDEFDAARTEFLAAISASDPDADTLAPPAPWFGIFAPQPIKARYYLLHQVEEMARHAGHADIIREQIDGMAVPALVMTLEGAQANAYFQPYEPAPGTIGT